MSELQYQPPWKRPLFIGVAGCSGSGKTSIVSAILQKLNLPWMVVISLDNFYRPLNDDQRKLAFESKFDFDSPEAVDFDLMLEVMENLKAGRQAEVPIYSFKDHDRIRDKKHTVFGASVVLVEGIYALYDERILKMLDLKVFVQEDADVCMARRLHRDLLYRGRQLDLSIQQWHRFVKPNYHQNIVPTAKMADIIVPKGLENKVAIDMLLRHIRRHLSQASLQHLSELQKLGAPTSESEGFKLNDLVYFPEQSNQLQTLHTILLNRQTNRDQFIFYFNRVADILITLGLEAAWEDLGNCKRITTPNGCQFDGLELPFDKVLAVTMVRGGECFESALKANVPTIPLGRLLIQSTASTGEPQLHVCQLPPCIGQQQSKVLLTDCQILSGSAVVMAVAVLISHGIREQDIIVVVYSSSEIGIRRVKAAYPKIKMVVGRVSPTILSMDLDVRYYGH